MPNETKKLIEDLAGLITWLNKPKMYQKPRNRQEDIAKLQQIKEILEKSKTDEYTASWMDRCHELEIELAKLKKEAEEK